MPPALALAVPAMRKTQTFEAAAAPFSSAVPNQQLAIEEAISTPMSSAQVQQVVSAGECLLMNTVCP
jgi:hypothetical protein